VMGAILAISKTASTP